MPGPCRAVSHVGTWTHTVDREFTKRVRIAFTLLHSALCREAFARIRARCPRSPHSSTDRPQAPPLRDVSENARKGRNRCRRQRPNTREPGHLCRVDRFNRSDGCSSEITTPETSNTVRPGSFDPRTGSTGCLEAAQVRTVARHVNKPSTRVALPRQANLEQEEEPNPPRLHAFQSGNWNRFSGLIPAKPELPNCFQGPPKGRWPG